MMEMKDADVEKIFGGFERNKHPRIPSEMEESKKGFSKLIVENAKS